MRNVILGRRVSLVMRKSLLSLLAIGALTPSLANAQIYLRRNAQGTLEATDSPESSDFRLRYGKGVLIHSKSYRRRARPEFDPFIEDAAARFRLDPNFIKAIMSVESDFDEFATSSKGAQGLMQLMPATARRFGVTNAFDPQQAIMGGAEYLRYLLDLFDGNIEMAAAGYNAGEGAVLKYHGVPPYKETRNYVIKVQRALDGAPLIQRTARSSGPSTPSTGFAGGSLPPSLQPTRPVASSTSARVSAPAAPTRPTRVAKRIPPRIYYSWKDDGGTTHLADAPPPQGVAFRTIRGLN